MKDFIIGLDIGTTSTKAVVFDQSGQVIAENEVEYSLIKEQPSWAEQNPVKIEIAAKQSIKGALLKENINKNSLIGIGISSAMHSLICVDEQNQPLTNSITWADGRSSQQAEQLKSNPKGLNIYLNTGTPIHPMSPLLKLIWMKETNFEPYKKAAKFISIKEYLLHEWFGTYVVDYSVAAATGMFNIRTQTWDHATLQLAGISSAQLSTIVEPTYQLKGLSKCVAEEMGINCDLPFIIGASDGPLANLGIGAIEKGELAVTIGTSGAVRQMATEPHTDDKQEIFCYSFTKDLWVMGGPTNNGGIVFQWLKDLLGEVEVIKAKDRGIDPYDLLTEMAQKVTPGSNGLLFMPHLNGERAPFWDAKARGSYIGLTLSHQKPHLVRSGLEGVILSIYHVGEALNRLAGEPKTIYASGGFARSNLWLQILADVFGTEVRVPESHQSSAWGAAWIALLSLGKVQSLQDIKQSIPMKNNIIPNANNYHNYQQIYQIYRELYDSLKSQFHKLAQL